MCARTKGNKKKDGSTNSAEVTRRSDEGAAARCVLGQRSDRVIARHASTRMETEGVDFRVSPSTLPLLCLQGGIRLAPIAVPTLPEHAHTTVRSTRHHAVHCTLLFRFLPSPFAIFATQEKTSSNFSKFSTARFLKGRPGSSAEAKIEETLKGIQNVYF